MTLRSFLSSSAEFKFRIWNFELTFVFCQRDPFRLCPPDRLHLANLFNIDGPIKRVAVQANQKGPRERPLVFWHR